MLKFAISVNILFLILSIVLFFVGSPTSAFFGLVYGMALGSLYGKQKLVFHFIALILNSICVAVGLMVLTVLILQNSTYMLGFFGLVIVFSLCVLGLIVAPVCNVLLIKKKFK